LLEVRSLVRCVVSKLRFLNFIQQPVNTLGPWTFYRVVSRLKGADMKTDSELKKDVLTELAWDPVVPEAHVGVAVDTGVVTLYGHLDTYEQKVAAKRAAERVTGVRAIALELEVVPRADHERSDTGIAGAIDNALDWSTLVPRDQIHVAVEHGWVTLTGEVNWNYQRRVVERLIRPLKGVVGITDSMRLKPRALPDDLNNRIKEAFSRQAMREAKRIEVEVNGHTVTLRGQVHSWADRNAAEGVTWSAPGVTRVNNKLVVSA
jgi:osmotically-inducible protein OsmY